MCLKSAITNKLFVITLLLFKIFTFNLYIQGIISVMLLPVPKILRYCSADGKNRSIVVSQN